MQALIKNKLFILAALLCISVYAFYFVLEYEQGYQFKKEYGAYNNQVNENGETYQSLNLPLFSRIKYLNPTEIDKVKNGIIYFGYPKCPYCRNTVPVLLQLTENNHLTVYYVNVDGWRDKYVAENGAATLETAAGDGYYDCLERYSDYLDDYTICDTNGNIIFVGEKRMHVPFLVRVENGITKAVWSSEYLDFDLLPQNPYQLWDTNQQAYVLSNLQSILPG